MRDYYTGGGRKERAQHYTIQSAQIKIAKSKHAQQNQRDGHNAIMITSHGAAALKSHKASATNTTTLRHCETQNQSRTLLQNANSTAAHHCKTQIQLLRIVTSKR